MEWAFILVFAALGIASWIYVKVAHPPLTPEEEADLYIKLIEAQARLDALRKKHEELKRKNDEPL